MYWRDYYYYTPARPKEVKGGIKAQSKQGDFGKSWWAKRWVNVLESFNIGQRLARGRRYARQGQVVSIEVGKGEIMAEVQGTRPKPYKIKIKVKTLSKKEWQKVADALSGQAIFAAKLLSGEMPHEIEKVFDKAKVSLFPEKYRDLSTNCSCPDWSNPCKHIAAVFYILGEEFDRDPFLIFKMRGMEKKEFVGLLGVAAEDTDRGTEDANSDVTASSPLSLNAELFWGSATPGIDGAGEVKKPPVNAAVLKQLGNFPMWRAEERFMNAMERLYKKASEQAINVLWRRNSKPR